MNFKYKKVYIPKKVLVHRIAEYWALNSLTKTIDLFQREFE